MKITSRDNSLLRQAREVRDGKARESIFVEGLRLCEEALRSNLNIEAVIYSEHIARKDRAANLIHELESIAATTASVSEKLLESISYTKTPQGIVVIAARPQLTETQFKATQSTNPLLVILHGINNPVNVGAILRTGEAAGATGVIATRGTSDPFSPKSLRGAMGATFRLPVWTDAEFQEVIDWCRAHKIQTAAAATVNAKQSYVDFDWRIPTALVMGAESAGLSEKEVAATDESVNIPMQGSTESLNVAVAAGILLYEAYRQRSA
ncbi:MAG TPA: RNA methyltransferase [Pyrinomonadaceae bacterium]|nr:RNA methyltransferase [Pyrinomonadaceae bacterium]